MAIQVDFIWPEFWASEWGKNIQEHATLTGRSIGGSSLGDSKKRMDKIEKYLLDQKQKWLNEQGYDFNKQTFEITNKPPVSFS